MVAFDVGDVVRIRAADGGSFFARVTATDRGIVVKRCTREGRPWKSASPMRVARRRVLDVRERLF